jgi:hypothetical protein
MVALSETVIDGFVSSAPAGNGALRTPKNAASKVSVINGFMANPPVWTPWA